MTIILQLTSSVSPLKQTMCRKISKAGEVFKKEIYLIVGPSLSALGRKLKLLRGKIALDKGTNSFFFMAEDGSSMNGRNSLLKHRWKSVDKLCGFREPFFRGHKVHPRRARRCPVGKSDCIRSLGAVIKPRIAYTAEIIDYPAFISGQVGHFENQTVTSPSPSLRYSPVYSFAILLRLSGRRGSVFWRFENLMKNKHIFSPERAVSRSPTPALNLSFG